MNKIFPLIFINIILISQLFSKDNIQSKTWESPSREYTVTWFGSTHLNKSVIPKGSLSSAVYVETKNTNTEKILWVGSSYFDESSHNHLVIWGRSNNNYLIYDQPERGQFSITIVSNTIYSTLLNIQGEDIASIAGKKLEIVNNQLPKSWVENIFATKDGEFSGIQIISSGVKEISNGEFLLIPWKINITNERALLTTGNCRKITQEEYFKKNN